MWPFFGPCDHLGRTMWSSLTISQGGTHVWIQRAGKILKTTTQRRGLKLLLPITAAATHPTHTYHERRRQNRRQSPWSVTRLKGSSVQSWISTKISKRADYLCEKIVNCLEFCQLRSSTRFSGHRGHHHPPGHAILHLGVQSYRGWALWRQN